MNGTLLGGRYEISEKIATGGMADVYVAVDRTLGREVAVKILHPQYAHDENFVTRFRREAQAAANLNHPNVVNVYDWGAEGDTYFLVMERLSGQTLKSLIQQRAPFDNASIIDIGRKVASALGAAHAGGIVHRDIKPQNIIITKNGEVKVTDFGIARSISSTMTQTGSIMGTAQYLSPEQAQGGAVSSASDIYSLGIVLYEMATGQVPFTGESAVAVALKHVREAPKPPKQLNSAISEGLNSTILRAISKHPSDRYDSADELVADLDRAAKGLAVAPAATGGEETVVIPRPSVLPTEPRTISASPKRRALPRWLLPVGGAVAGLSLLAAALFFYFGNSAVATTKVPRLVGKTLKQARLLAAQRDLKLKVSRRVFSSKPSGIVIDQSPDPGADAAAGSTVLIEVSRGKELLLVPNVVGKSSDQATYLVAKAGLEIGPVTRQYSFSVDEGIVMSQTPAGGERAARGTIVNLVVSRGPAPIRVPDLQNKTESEAAALLSQQGLAMTKSEEFSDTVAAGRVIRTIPSAGSTTQRGGTVAVVISRGPELFSVPDVQGEQEKTAKARLVQAGFVVVVKEGVSAPEDVGKVVNQNPEPGAQVAKGTTVTIWVGQEPPTD